MIHISKLSLINTILLSNIFIIIFILFTNKIFLFKISIKTFIIFGILIILRIFLPVEFLFTKEIESFNIYPYIINLLKHKFYITQYLYFNVKQLILFLWIIIAITIIINKLFLYIRIRNTLSDLPETENIYYINILNNIKKQKKIKFNIKLLVNKSIPTVMEYGFFNKVILIPENIYSTKELNYILLHEISHFLNRTNFIKLFIDILCSIFWWNPIMSIFKKKYYSLLEIHCDYIATKDLSIHDKKEYLFCLLKHIKQNFTLINGNNSNIISYFFNYKSKNILKNRVYLVMDFKKNKILEYIIIIFSILLFISSYFIILQPAYKPAVDITLQNINNYDYSINYENNKYILYIDKEPIITFNSKEEIYKLGLTLKGE